MGARRRGEEGRARGPGDAALQGESRVPGAREPGGTVRSACTELPGNALAAAAARSFVEAALREWGLRGMLVDDAVLLVSELVTNAVVHAGTAVDLECRQANGILVAEVSDRHPARAVLARADEGHGYGLRLISALAKEWGISYRKDRKTVWFRLGPAGRGPHGSYHDDEDGGAELGHAGYLAPGHGPRAPGEHRAPRLTRPYAAAEWTSHGALSFLAEASDLLAGHTDEDKVASLAGQLMVPRFADWCAVWLEDPDEGAVPRLARVWHAQEDRIEELRAELQKDPPALTARSLPGQALPWRWPTGAASTAPGGASAACRLVVGGRVVGTLLIGRAGLLRIPDEVMGLIEDFARRVALAVLSARRYTRQATISQILQRGLLPSGEAAIPGLDTAVVYEPSGEGAWAGGDFYDLLELPDGRWRFALGDVQGNGPEAAVVTGLARPVLRLLAREGFSVTETMDRLNREIGEQARFLSLLYGELSFRPEDEGGVDCSVVCAGHPLPLIRDAAGGVRVAALPQILLGVMRDVAYDCQLFTLQPGDTMLCVTDGVTERRSGRRLFDDGDGLATVLGTCEGLDAAATAERVRRAVHDFAPGRPTDDLALLVLRAPA
ncbi:hypothetical protein GCM10009801_52730 [Streptomyces albiaxialis]|uniref:PPM-type phosphatase domain-containing protein n=1 Tax=Streptomyces albiaxialis TaxID=329523 RepID=A0ABN2WCG7_9ACTN